MNRFTVIPAIAFFVLYFDLGLSAQAPTLLQEIGCSPSKTPPTLDSLSVVGQCSIDSNLHWILAWGKAGNYIVVQQGENTILRRSCEEGEEGYIVHSKFYRSKEKGLHYILAVFGMEDGDISIKVFGLKNRILKFYGAIPALAQGGEDDYNDAPLESLQVFEKEVGQLDILLPDLEYEIWGEGKLERWNGPLHYTLKGGQILRQQ
ncbi:MAG: hypothetical protein HRU41_36975 [Saprospiraceae bacterium]|nr:hypothetical protein [Saprospiraceae bacterium]